MKHLFTITLALLLLQSCDKKESTQTCNVESVNNIVGYIERSGNIQIVYLKSNTLQFNYTISVDTTATISSMNLHRVYPLPMEVCSSDGKNVYKSTDQTKKYLLDFLIYE